MLAPGVNFSKFMFPGIIGMTVLMTSLMSGVSVVWDREFGFLKEVLVAPISRVAVATGKTLGGATIALIQGIMILLFAPLFGVTLPLGTLPLLIPTMFVVACALAALGILLASLIKSMEANQAVMQLLVFPMVFLSGIFFPMRNLPQWMSVLVKLNPATYAVDPIRQLLLGTEPASYLGITIFGHTMSIGDDLIVVGGFGVVMICLAMWSFGSQE